jgi:hypothetical protein
VDRFAALGVTAGAVIGEVHRRYCSIEFQHLLRIAAPDLPQRASTAFRRPMSSKLSSCRAVAALPSVDLHQP